MTFTAQVPQQMYSYDPTRNYKCPQTRVWVCFSASIQSQKVESETSKPKLWSPLTFCRGAANTLSINSSRGQRQNSELYGPIWILSFKLLKPVISLPIISHIDSQVAMSSGYSSQFHSPWDIQLLGSVQVICKYRIDFKRCGRIVRAKKCRVVGWLISKELVA